MSAIPPPENESPNRGDTIPIIESSTVVGVISVPEAAVPPISTEPEPIDAISPEPEPTEAAVPDSIPVAAPPEPVRRPALREPLSHELLRIAVLIVFAIGVWCWITGRTNLAAWQVPLEYGMKGADGDAIGFMSHIKEASEGEFSLLGPRNITRLGAPYYSSLSDIPLTEFWMLYLPGVLARSIGLFAAANAAILIAQILACLCFYIVARWLGCKWWWAFTGGILFGFAQFAFARSLHHINVTNYWYVPFCLLIADWMTRNEMGDIRGRRYLFAVLASFVMGMLNPYYTNMFLQLTLLGAFYQYFRQGWAPVRQAGGIVAAAGFGFFLMNLNTFINRIVHGANPGALPREFKWLELSALKFVDMLVPPQDHPLLGKIGQAYYGLAGREYDPSIAKMVAFPAEVPPSCYLGLLGIAALVWLAAISIRRLMVENGRNLPLEAWQVLWILAYASVGGLNCLAGICGVTMFRSSTRYCIFILPIVLLFALKRLSRKRFDQETEIGIAALCALFALWDQTPPTTTSAKIADDARVVDADRQFTRSMEARLPQGAMIFQIPVMEFPESPAPGMPSYDHFRPYLHSEHLRFSFGGIKGRPWLNWQKDLTQKPFPEVIQTLESYGFAAIYCNRNGFPDRAEGLLKEFRRLGYNELLESKFGDLFCVVIHPDRQPVLPAGVVKR